ncbi:MAG TPA: cytochrome c peroxidase [Bacteroidales bacterium]|nr:cytochrome c peroxidase [Bacteroidales bacterium]
MKTYPERRVVMILALAIPILFLAKCRDKEDAKVLSTPVSELLANQELQDLGERLFFDSALSEPEGQSCAACHGAGTGWTGPDEKVNQMGGIYEGALKGRFGNRKPNSAAYAAFAPLFNSYVDDGNVLFAGGNFWDGRATGHLLGNPAADQAQGPFLNPVEQNVAGAAALMDKIKKSSYAVQFNDVAKKIWKQDNILEGTNVNLQFGIVGIAIAAFERSEKVSPFTSKFDYYLKGEAELTKAEKTGLALFNGKARCSSCHTSSSENGLMPLFTDFRFDNLGIPANPDNPWYNADTAFNKAGKEWIDGGLADYLKTQPQYAMYAEQNLGKHQVPTLRNVDKRPSEGFVKAYGHNGYFRSLEDVVHFYNTRDVSEPESGSMPPARLWPEPEVKENINKADLGNLGLTAEEEAAIVAFMRTLSDGYVN